MEILVILLLTLLNGVFSLSEIALLSVKKHKIEQRVLKGSRNARLVIELLKHPESFLSAVQVGITLIGIVSGAYGGVTLTENLVPYVEKINFLSPYAYEFSFVLIIGLITYFTIVFGELLPKTIALNYSEQFSLIMAPFVKFFSILTYPFVKLLSFSTRMISGILRLKNNSVEGLSEEELKYLLKNAEKQGVLEEEQTQMHQNIFFFYDQKAKNLQTIAADIEWININDSIDNIEKKIRNSSYSKFPVCDGELDKICGIITAEDFFEKRKHKKFSLKKILKTPIFIPENMNAFDVLKIFKKYKQYLGIVVDEFGGVNGILTIHDLTEAIVGDLPDYGDENDPEVVTRDDNSLLVDGGIQIYQFNKFIGAKIISDKSTNYITLGGFIIHHLKRIPKSGEKFIYKGYKFEIIDLDGRRVDKVLISKVE